MIKRINNLNELNIALMPTMVKMVDTLKEEVYETLNYFLQKYYDDYDPKSYKRQYDFLRSAIEVETKVKGNKVVASVYIDTDSMDNYYGATGEQVARWANEGTHGGLYTGSKTPRVWDDTLNETVRNGKLLNQAVEYLKSKGISVRA